MRTHTPAARTSRARVPSRSGSLPGSAARSYRRFLPKALLAYALLGLAFYVLFDPFIIPLIARAARDVVLLTPGVPRISVIVADGSYLHVESPLDNVFVAVTGAVRMFAFSLLLPVSLTFSLPFARSRDKVGALSFVVAVSFITLVFHAAIACMYYFSRSVFERYGWWVYPPSRQALINGVDYWSWPLIMILLPGLLSIYAVIRSLVGEAGKRTWKAGTRFVGSKRLPPARPSQRPILYLRASLPIVGVLILLALLDLTASRRLASTDPVRLRYEIASLNPGKESAILGRPVTASSPVSPGP